MSDDAAETPAPAAKPKGSLAAKLTPLLLLANLGGTGLIAFKTLKAHPAAAAAHPAAEAEKPHLEPPLPGAVVTGPVVPMDTFVVNLNEPGSSRFLKATFELELTSKDAEEELAKGKRLVRDEILRYLSSLTVEKTLGEENKTKIRDDIRSRADKLLGDGRIRRVFFTDFVVQ